MPKKDKDKKKEPPAIIKPFTDRFKLNTGKKEEPVRASINEPVVTRDEKGQLEGVIFPDGREFHGLKQEDVRGLLETTARRTATPAGAIEQSTQRKKDILATKTTGTVEQTAEEFLQNEQPPGVLDLQDVTPEEEAEILKQAEQEAVQNLNENIVAKAVKTLAIDVPGLPVNLALKAFGKPKLSDLLVKAAAKPILKVKQASETTPVSILGFNIGEMITGLLGDNPKKAQELQSALEAKNGRILEVTRAALNQDIDPGDAQVILDEYEKNINDVRDQLQAAIIQSPAIQRDRTVEDIETDLGEVYDTLFFARTQLNQAIVTGEFDPLEVSLRIEQLRKSGAFEE